MLFCCVRYRYAEPYPAAGTVSTTLTADKVIGLGPIVA